MYRFIITSLLISFSIASHAGKTVSISLNKETNADFTVATAKGDTLLLIMPSEYGIQQADKQLLQRLPAAGIEVWLSNILEAYFLENSASNLERIPSRDVQQLLKNIHRKTKKNIILLSAGRGAIPILRALASWPDKTSPTYISGLILMHPKLFKTTPEPGSIAKLMPSVGKTNQLIYLIQPMLSPFWWNRNISMQGLQESGSDVFLRPLKDIRNRFYFREDASAKELRLKSKYPKLIYKAITQIKRYPKTTRLIATRYAAKPTVTSTKKERLLSPYKGKPTPPALKLRTLTNRLHDLKQDKGKVVLVNFWASWCPPCVHEMPSMQRLEDFFQQKNTPNKNTAAFKILAVNMAEDEKTISTFLKAKVSVNFDILLDNKGEALKDWKVFAFPTSFIIGKKGKIRYAIYGGLIWDTPHIKDKIQQLLDE